MNRSAPSHLRCSATSERMIRTLAGLVDRIALRRALRELPEGCRTIFALHEVEGYQHHEIAQILDCSIGNSKSQLHKAKLKMRDLALSEAENPAPSARAAQGRVRSGLGNRYWLRFYRLHRIATLGKLPMFKSNQG